MILGADNETPYFHWYFFRHCFHCSRSNSILKSSGGSFEQRADQFIVAGIDPVGFKFSAVTNKIIDGPWVVHRRVAKLVTIMSYLFSLGHAEPASLLFSARHQLRCVKPKCAHFSPRIEHTLTLLSPENKPFKVRTACSPQRLFLNKDSFLMRC